MPRQSTDTNISINSTSPTSDWRTINSSATSNSSSSIIKADRNQNQVKKKTNKDIGKPKEEGLHTHHKRDIFENYFHEQSKLFSALQKRYDAFQNRVAEEKERNKNIKNKSKNQNKVVNKSNITPAPALAPKVFQANLGKNQTSSGQAIGKVNQPPRSITPAPPTTFSIPK